MKKYYLFFIAIILLVLDIRIETVAYPVYEEFKTEAPETVDLVINHVLGEYVKLDLLSDTLGYLCLALSAVILGLHNKKFRKVIVWTALSLGMYVYRYIMPFMLNGSDRFRVGYLVYYIAAILEVITVFYAMYALCHQLETLENHSYNNITVIVAMLCMGTGFVAAIMYFFDIMVVAAIYYGIRIVTMGVYWYLVYRDKKLLVEWEETHA